MPAGSSRRRFARAAALVLLAALASCALAALYWLRLRPQPEPIRERWFAGVDYERIVLRQPRPVVAHFVRIDLDAPGIDFVVTPPEPSADGNVRSRTTSAFAREHGLQVAINASYFYPFRNTHPLDYAPHPGDPVHALGTTASRGLVYGAPWPAVGTLHLSRDRRVSFEERLGEPWNAVSGLGYVILGGGRADFTPDTFTAVPYPRTLVGADERARALLMLVIDGKQPGYSEGMTLREAAELLIARGAHTALQLDGGGSSVLVRETAPRVIDVVSTPANFKIPAWERSVATHLGVRARR